MRAKFTCDEIHHRHTTSPDEVNAEVLFRATFDKMDSDFTQATPWGELKMGVTNPAALAQLELGKAYFLDFTPVDD